MKRLWMALFVVLASIQLSGCAALWFGAGAATGAAAHHEYEEHK